MEEASNKNIKTIITLAAVIVALVIIGGLYLFKPDILNKIVKPIGFDAERPQVVKENLSIPQTEKITGSDARVVQSGTVEVKLVPKSDGEKVVVEKAILTVKGSYELAKKEAGVWASDAKLVFVKSLGAITLDGKSSQWQVAFASPGKKGKGYEVVIQGDQVVSKKEIDSNASGASIPDNLKDSQAAIASLQNLPQFSDATISSISLYYNTDGKVWRYALSTSRGATSMSATE